MSYYEQDDGLGALEVTVSDLLIATPDACDPLLDPAVHQVLKLLRDQHAMDAAFACEVNNGQRVSRRVEPSQRAQFIDEQAEPLELAFCKQVLSARVPAGCYLSAPVILAGGSIYGTFYSFCFNPDPAIEARDLKKLEMAAQLAARLIDERRPHAAALMSASLAPAMQRQAAEVPFA
jgi:hypothetical protein